MEVVLFASLSYILGLSVKTGFYAITGSLVASKEKSPR